jgi:methionine synthase / methylenetetrahydrofolate reductase(NADPH)
MSQFAEILASRPLLADGAMGTVLYARGIFINRCYDELNLSDPNLILSVHEEYLQAGAEILETNTFGGNRMRLARHGLAGKVAEINAAGARLARQAVNNLKQKQAGEAWVAGSVGPLGVRLEPLGKTSLDEARTAFAEQMQVLADGGVDLLIIETMPALNEARQALEAARQVAPGLPVVVMVTVDDESTCLDGASPQLAAALLTEWGASAVGVNCSTAHGGDAERRLTSRSGGSKHIFVLAGIHGQLCPQGDLRRRSDCWRVLRNYAEPHSRHALCDSRHGRAGSNRGFRRDAGCKP